MHRVSGRKPIWIISISIVLVVAVSVLWLLNRPTTHDCVIQASTDLQKIHATKVVVEPWLGRHHVYGVLMIPLGYRSGRAYSGKLTVEGYAEEFIPDWHEVQLVDGSVAEPGHYLVQTYIPTRVALSFLFTGRFGDLKNACNWMIEIAPKPPIPAGSSN